MNLIQSFVISFILIIFIVVLVFVSVQQYRIQNKMNEISLRESKQDLGLKFSKETSKSIIEFLNTLNVEEIKTLPNLISDNKKLITAKHNQQAKQIEGLKDDISLLRRNVSYNLNRFTIDFIDSYVESCSEDISDVALTVIEKDVLQKTYVFGLFSGVMNEIFDIEEIIRTHKSSICSIITTLKNRFLSYASPLNNSTNAIERLEKVILTNYGTNTNEGYTSLPVIPMYAYIEKNKHELYTVLKDKDLRTFIFEIYFPNLLRYVLYEDIIFKQVDTMMLNFFNHHKMNTMYSSTTNPFVYFNQFFLEYDDVDDARNNLLELLFNNINREIIPIVNISDDSVISKLLYLYIPEMLIMWNYATNYASTSIPTRFKSVNENPAYPYENILNTIFNSTEINEDQQLNYMTKRFVELFSKQIKDENKHMNYRYDIFKQYLTQFETNYANAGITETTSSFINQLYDDTLKYDELFVDSVTS